MNQKNIAVVVLLLTGAVIVIIGVVLFVRESQTEDVIEEELINQPQISLHEISTATLSPFTSNPVSIPRTVFIFHKCPKEHIFHHPKRQWSVRVEACTYNVGTPLKGVIQNWQLADTSLGQKKHKFALHENGSFDIKEEGFYKIYSKVTFQRSEESDYSINISNDAGNKIYFSIKNQIKTQQGDLYVVESIICGNITQKLSLFINIPKPALIFFYPQQTFFTVTKWN